MCELSSMNKIWKENNRRTNLESSRKMHWYSLHAEHTNSLVQSHLQDGVWHF